MAVQPNGRATRARGVSVYLMSSGEKTKIGFSAKPEARASNMRVGSSQGIEIHTAFRLPNREAAASVERASHKALAWCRSHGEWFAIKARYAEGVVRHLVAGDILRADRLSRHLQRLTAIEGARAASRWPGLYKSVDNERLDRLSRLEVRAYKLAVYLGVPSNEWDDVL